MANGRIIGDIFNPTGNAGIETWDRSAINRADRYAKKFYAWMQKYYHRRITYYREIGKLP